MESADSDLPEESNTARMAQPVPQRSPNGSAESYGAGANSSMLYQRTEPAMQVIRCSEAS